MKTHPEAQNNEIFVGNVEALPKYLSDLKTPRLGTIAYYIDSKEIPKTRNLFPLFIGKKEFSLYDKIMCDRVKAIKRWSFGE